MKGLGGVRPLGMGAVMRTLARRDPAARRIPPGRALAALALLVSLFSGLFLATAHADDPAERLTPERRQEMGRQAVAHLEAGGQAYQRGDLTTAVEEARKSVQLFEQLYPKSDYPQGHTDLANSLNGLGYLLKAQGDYGGARRYYERALAMNEALYPKDRFPHGHPDLAEA